MKWIAVASVAMSWLVGCGLPQDEGVVMGCFGLVNETVSNPDVFSTEVVTNTYFGGCDPSDPGMHIIERATTAAAADQTIMVPRCDFDCNARLVAYAAAHPEVALPLSCQTFFAIPCEGLGSDVTQVGTSEAIFQGGGPADTRVLLTGTVTLTVDGETRVVPASGIVDGTLAATCQGEPQSCPVTLSRLDVVGLEPFTLGGAQIDSVHIQNQGVAIGSKTGGQIVIGSEAIEAEVSAVTGGGLKAFHIRNDVPVQAGGDPTLEQFLSSLDVTMTQGNVSVHIAMIGTPVGRRPVAAFTYECQSAACTTVRLTSTASDPDDDLQNLSWLVDGTPQAGNMSGAPDTIDLALAVGPHTLSLVATDSRGAASAASLEIHVGPAPVVTFTMPTPGQFLCPAGPPPPGCVPDANTSTPGWQGSIAVHVTGDGQPLTSANVTFTIGTTTLGTGPVALDASGNAVLSGITLAEGTFTIVATTDDIPNRGVGTGSVQVTVDLTPPGAPTSLTAAIADRRKTSLQLAWTAPGDGGAAVTGYDIRYAKTQITDDASFNAAMAVTYTGIPPAPGQTDGILVDKLYIENGYFFALKARDAAGNRSPMVATPTAVTAHFNVSLIPSPSGTNQSFGVTFDGSQDVNDDGNSDLLVGTFNDNHAYLFLGASPFAPSAPTTTFTGTNVGFGATVRQIGDIDDDGLQDVAIADRPTGLRVFIYKGRTSWPATLTDLQADYVVTTNSAFANSQFGASIERIGDFNGDGVDDFAITAPLYSSRLGRAVVVYGSRSFSGFAVPDTTRALEIGPDPALTRTQFGSGIIGLGHFYVGSGTTIVISATGLAPQPSDNAGRLYAFHGRGPGTPIDATIADNVFVGPGTGSLIGNQLTNLGPLEGGLPMVGCSNLSDALSVPGNTGTAYLFSGTSSTGPFANNLIAYRAGTNLAGQALFGGGFSGIDGFVSLIGDSRPDVALSGQVGSTLDIIDGSRLGALTSPVNTATAADVHVPMPPGWLGTTNAARAPVRDINRDGYADFALGDVFGSVPGRVAVFW